MAVAGLTFLLGEELTHTPPAEHLAPLLRQVEAGTIKPVLDSVRPWSEIATVAREFLERQFAGKAVLTLGGGR